MPPGFAASVIAIGMTERDGLVVLIGTLVSAVAIAVASVATGSAILDIINYFTRLEPRRGEVSAEADTLAF